MSKSSNTEQTLQIRRSDGTVYTKNKKILKMTKEQVAYIAGIIDGEGSIGLSKKSGGSGNRRGVAYRPSVGVPNTNRQLLEWLKTTTGLGSISPIKKTNDKHKQAFRWSLWSKQAAQLVSKVRPYLIVKARQAETLEEFLAIDKIPRGPLGLSDATWNQQVAAYDKLKELNKRGA